MKNIYVGNISFKTTEQELRKLFEPFGVVERISLPRDHLTLRTRGFAFVEMQDDNAGNEAIRALNGAQLGGRTIVVNEARHRPESAYPRRPNGERRFGRG